MATTAAPTLSSPIFRRPSAAPKPHPPPFVAPFAHPSIRLVITCQVAIHADAPSSSSEADEESEALAKVGKRVRVKVPLKVYHVAKAPELDLMGLEGVVKQYVGVWKGKKVSANLPFKAEFVLPENSDRGPVKFSAHLREDEFEYLDQN